MEKFFIEEAKCELTKGGIACGPVDPNVVTTVKYKCGDETKWISLVEVMGIPNFLLSEKDIHEGLVKEDDSDKEFWDYVHEINIGEFNGIELGEYGDIFASFADDPENPAIPLIRYMIALTRCPLDQVEDLLNMARGKYVNELDIPASDVEEDFEEEYEEKDE